MNKQELVKEVSKKLKVSTKSVADVIDAAIEEIKKSVSQGNKVGLVGFGSFEQRKRAARTGRNPRTGEAFQIQAKKVPIFCAGKDFRTRVGGALETAMEEGEE